MKLQFDPNQQFQLDAVAAVTDLFDGQPQSAPEYAVINVGPMEGLFAGQDRSELGVGNRLLIAQDRLRENLRALQTRNDIERPDLSAAPEAWELFDGPANQPRPCPHFSVEMETGTGKTYVYRNAVIHGPLNATQLAGYAEEVSGKRLREFNYRPLAPTFLGDCVTHRADVQHERTALHATPGDGTVCMQADAIVA